MGINTPSEIETNLQIGPTDTGMVRIYVSGGALELPMDFDPDEADEIAQEIIAAAVRAVSRRGELVLLHFAACEAGSVDAMPNCIMAGDSDSIPNGNTVNQPNKPALIMAPLRTALAGAGATGCANGNQTCSPITPAFTPKPSHSNSAIHAPWSAVARVSRTPLSVNVSEVPAAQRKPPNIKPSPITASTR
mgnify:CR=1 FL=1